MNSSIVSQSGGSVGIGFAVPSNTLRALVPQLREYGRAARPLLGIAVADDKFTETLGIAGVVVLDVQPGSLAATAGMTGVLRGPDGSVLLGDVIVALDDQPVENSDDLLYALERRSPGDVVTVHTRFRGDSRTYRLTLRAPQR